MRRLSPPRGFGKLIKSKGDEADGQGGAAQSGANSAEYQEDIERHSLDEGIVTDRTDEDSEQCIGSFNPLQPDSNRDSVSSSDGQVSDLPGDGNREGTGGVRTEGVPDGDGSDFQPGSQSYSEGDSETGFVAECADKLKFVLELSAPHFEELKQSAISDEIAALNFSSSDDLSSELDLSNAPRTNSGGVVRYVRKKVAHYEHGGWVVRGIDPETGETMEWGQVKLNRPRWDSSKGKPIKYEAQAGMATRLYFLRIPFETWRLIAKRFKVAMPEDIEPDDPQLSWKFWQWVKQYPEIPIILTEGAKKAAALLSAGYCAIAAPGIWNFTPNKQIHTDLLPFVCEGRILYIAFDEDEKTSTRGAVAAAIKRLARLCKGCDTRVMDWNPLDGKGIDDVIVRFNHDKLHKIFREAVAFEAWEVQTFKGLSREPDLKLNQRYLNFKIHPGINSGQLKLDLENPTAQIISVNTQLIAIKAPKGTGKTEWFARYVKEIVESGTRPVICLAHRIKLMMQTAKRVGVRYIEDCTSKEMLKQGMALCIDSFRPGGRGQIDPDLYRNAIVFIDEVCQVVLHLLNSSTCQKYRVEIMQCFKELLQMIASFDGQVVIADADLNDTVLNLIEELMGVKAYLVVNDYKGENNFDVVNFPQSNPTELLAKAYESIDAGKKCLILTDAQKESAPYSSTNIEFKLRERMDIDVSCLRIDGETSSDSSHPASRVMSYPEALKNYQVTIATSVIETGVSIDFEHFDEVYLIGNGVVACDSVRQFLSRYRIPCPRFVWIKKTGNNYIGNKATTPKQLYAAEKQKDKAILGQFVQFGINEEGEQVENVWLDTWAKLGAIHNSGNKRYRQQVLEDLALEGHRVWSQEDWFKAQELYKEVSGKTEPPDNVEILKTLNNYQQFVDSVPEEFTDELNGKVAEKISQSVEQGNAVKAEAKEVKNINLNRKAVEVCEADNMSDEDYEEKKRQAFKSQAERNSIDKKILGIKYGDDNVSPQLYIKEESEKHFYSALRLNYHFSVGREFLNEKMASRWENILSEKRFIPDSNRVMSPLLKVKVLDKLRINEVLEMEEIHNNHHAAISIFESIGFVKNDEGKWKVGNWNPINSIKNYLGLDLSKAQSPIDAIKRIVGMLGLKIPLLKRSGSGQIRERIYGRPIAGWEKDEKGKPIIVDGRAIEIPDSREDIFAVWLERDAEARDKRTEASRLRQEKEAAADAYASRVKSEIESGSLPTQFQIEVEKNEYAPEDYIEIAYEMRPSQLNIDIAAAVESFGLDKVIEAGIRWAGECIDKLEWLMEHPQLRSAF